MLSVIIPTHDSERALVRTLAALVPGAAAGLVSEVLITDADFVTRPQPQPTTQVARFCTSRARWAGG